MSGGRDTRGTAYPVEVALAVSRVGGQSAVARRLGVSRQTVARWVQDGKVARADDAVRLSALSGIRVAYLAGVSGDCERGGGPCQVDAGGLCQWCGLPM